MTTQQGFTENTSCPRLGLDVPMDLTVTASTDNTITLVWGVVQGPIDHYKVTYTSSSGVSTEVKSLTDDQDTLMYCSTYAWYTPTQL